VEAALNVKARLDTFTEEFLGKMPPLLPKQWFEAMVCSNGLKQWFPIFRTISSGGTPGDKW
jgi:hypothetical protein